VAWAIAGTTIAQAVPCPAAPSSGTQHSSVIGSDDPAVRIGEDSEDLFDRASNSDWSSVPTLLRSLHEQARLLDGPFQLRFLRAGGNIDALIGARNALAGALADADIAYGAREPAALSSIATRVTRIAGELAEPFGTAPTASVELRVYAAMFQSSRMLDALRWGDEEAYEAAHGRFRDLWAEIRKAPGLDRDKVAELDLALARAALSRSEKTRRDLQIAAQNVIVSLRHPSRRTP
jgi:hypothetical protein